MSELGYLLPVLACPVMMGLMMWMMRAGSGKAQSGNAASVQEEINILRAELATLREQSPRQASSIGDAGTL